MGLLELGNQIDSVKAWKPTSEITPEDVERIAEIACVPTRWADIPHDIINDERGNEIRRVFTPKIYSGSATISEDVLQIIFKEDPDRVVQAACVQIYQHGAIRIHNLRDAIIGFGDEKILFAKQEPNGVSSAITIIEIANNRLEVRKVIGDKQ